MTERERLIDIIGDLPFSDEYNSYNSWEWAEHFADHLLANGVIVPPCKVGDTVYELVNWCDYTDCHFEGCAGCSHCNEKGIVERKFNYSYLGQIGKTVFLTESQAEEALKNEQEKL